jgi:LemA protein
LHFHIRLLNFSIMGTGFVVLIVILAVAVIFLLYSISTYNRLVKLRTIVEEAWSGINVQLKKRYDLIPNLVETVKGYATHESETFQRVTRARANAMRVNDLKSREAAENDLNKALISLLAVAEQYPELKANENFMQLQHQLSIVESDIEKSRRFYNGLVREKNIVIDTFPSNIIAGMFSFSKSLFFELENEEEKTVPQVRF